MPTVSITDPANNGDAFPATITGDYDLQSSSRLPAGVTVAITQEPNGPSNIYPAIMTPSGQGATDGTWSLAKPNNLTQGKTYTITASLGTAFDTKTGIQN